MKILSLNVMMMISLFCMILWFGNLEAAPQSSLIKSLPGFNGTFPSNHYSGYVSMDIDKLTENLFYYFVESHRTPASDPLVLWLNGGPGCSSFDGFVYEHGPFNFEASKQTGGLPVLHLNNYSWSTVSNIIYLDSPADTGLSYANGSSFYNTGDLQTATTTHTFLLKWFEEFPEYQENPFYLAGESYAGVFIPTIASSILKGNEDKVRPKINFKGYIIGNGVTDNYYDGNALIPFVHGMGLISNTIYEETVTACKGRYDDSKNKTECENALSKVDKVLEGLNTYDILEPCYHKPSNNEGNGSIPLSFKMLGVTDRPLPVRRRIYGRAWPLRATVEPGIVSLWPQLMEHNSFVPCVNDEVATAWLNNDAVKKSLHVRPESGTWTICTSNLRYSHDAGSMISYHKNLTLAGYRALIYSGDHDMCVPFTGTQAWTRSLGYKSIEEWRSWTSNEQVAGYIQNYENNLTFLTIKGAGHSVPEYKPREALDFYRRWLQGEPI